MKVLQILSIFIFIFCAPIKGAKIVGLVPVRNEEKMIVPCLKALSLYTDAIIVLDDASDDGTVAAIKSLEKECNIEKTIEKKVWYRDEPGDRNLLLQAGRQAGGTHFVFLDSDEMFTANLLKNNLLKNKILALKCGDKLRVTLINLWRSCNKYRYDYSVWCEAAADVAFCDDGKCYFESDFLHTSRSPNGLQGEVVDLVTDQNDFKFLNYCLDEYNQRVIGISSGKDVDRRNLHLQRYFIDKLKNKNMSLSKVASSANEFFWGEGTSMKSCYRHDFTAGLMHFQFVNWDNLLAKQAWYRCLEKIRNPKIDVDSINSKYGQSKDEKDIRCLECPKSWFEGYGFFDKNICEKNDSWQRKEIKFWFKKYGKDFFKDLDIWDVEWE